MITCSDEARATVEAALAGTLPSRTIRDNASRLVLCISPKQGPVLYLKKFKERDFFSRVRRWVADRAVHEAALLRRLRTAGVGAAEVVATGVHDEMSFLITEEVKGAPVLKEEIDRGAYPGNAARAMLVALGKFVRSVHDAGIRDDDLHLGNILVRPDGEFFLIDVHRAVYDSNVTLPERCTGLGFLVHSMHTLFGLTDQVRFLKAYWGEEYSRAILFDIRHEFDLARERYAVSRAARSMVTSGLFVKSDGVYLRRPLERPQAMTLVETNPLRQIKEVGSRRLWLIDSNRFVREDPNAEAIWKNAHALEVRHISTPRLWARFGNRVLGEWLGDAAPLNHYIEQSFPGMKRSGRREFLFQLARFVRGIHRNGAYHHDLKANNVLVRNRQGAGWDFFVIDIDRVTFKPVIPVAKRLFNLAQLNAALGAPVTWGDRLAFYRAYSGHNREWNLQWKRHVRKIMETTKARKHRWPVITPP